jgi:hypothetical protein
MPKRADLQKILIIGSGPIVIGQGCEFDYSGTQACKALRQEGYSIILMNSNPATIMTDPETAEVTYIEPLTVESVSAIIRRERPDALLPTVGGQTALNLAIALSKQSAPTKATSPVCIRCKNCMRRAVSQLRNGDDQIRISPTHLFADEFSIQQTLRRSLGFLLA